tara:strand:+ start:698 stop:1042 length:345 start_codon:yes stop_codon:yes gene_type:complete
MKTENPLLALLNHHVSGAIERGEAEAIVGIPDASRERHACLAERTDDDLARCYLDWVNNFISTEGFAAHYGVKKYEAVLIITAGRDVHESRVAKHAEAYAMARTGYAAAQSCHS